ncbi:MAG: sigma-70 family RNA polymerase sigma factor, partial [Desulfobacterales bacterium]
HPDERIPMTGEIDFKETYQEFQPKIHNYLTRLLGPHEAEDITQEVFEKVNRKLKTFKGESKFSTWLYRIATNAAFDRLRSAPFKHASQHISLENSAEAEDKNVWSSRREIAIDQNVIRKEMSACVREYVDKLPPGHRTVLILSEIEGFKKKEIADILQISIENVKIRLHRARAGLKKELNNGCDFYQNEQGTLACDRKPISIMPKKPD